jgi:hypothetical protein
MPLKRRTSILCGVVATSLALTACGGGGSNGKVSASSYVRSICQAIGPFQKDVQGRSSQLDLNSIKSPAQGKQVLQSFLTAVSADTDKAVAKIKSAGTPDVNNGKAISTAIGNAFTQLKGALSQAQSSANSLPTNSPQAFKTAAQALGNSVRNSMSNIGNGLTGLRSSQLESAAKKEPSCQALAA